MGFEESMIEDGFHDEEEYLEHLLDEAEKLYAHDNYTEEILDDPSLQEDDESFDESERIRYANWVIENPLEKEFFCAWLNTDICGTYSTYYIIEKFHEWEKNTEKCKGDLKINYGNLYPQIVEYFLWKIDNKEEDKLIRYEYNSDLENDYYSLSLREALLRDVENYQSWLLSKSSYLNWESEISDEEKKKFYEEVVEEEFGGDYSTEYVRKLVFSYIDENDESDTHRFTKWFDDNPQKALEIYFLIKCVQHKDTNDLFEQA